MAEQNYTLKVTLGEAMVIRQALAAEAARLELSLMPTSTVELDEDAQARLVAELDDARRLLSRMGR